MKRVIFFLSLLFFSFPLIYAGSFKLSLHGGWMGKEDEGFKEVYGKGGNTFGGMFEAEVVKDIFVYAGYQFFNKEGKTAIFEEKAETTQHYMSLGMSYLREIGYGLQMGIWAGGVLISYKEKALEEEVKDSCPGIDISAGLTYKINKKIKQRENRGEGFFVRGRIGYIFAKDRVEGAEIKFNGFQALFGIGYGF